LYESRGLWDGKEVWWIEVKYPENSAIQVKYQQQNFLTFSVSVGNLTSPEIRFFEKIGFL